MRFSDVFDTDDTKEIIYKSVTNATRDMVREWLDQNLALIAKEVINEANKIYDVNEVIPSIYLATELSRTKL